MNRSVCHQCLLGLANFEFLISSSVKPKDILVMPAPTTANPNQKGHKLFSSRTTVVFSGSVAKWCGNRVPIKREPMMFRDLQAALMSLIYQHDLQEVNNSRKSQNTLHSSKKQVREKSPWVGFGMVNSHGNNRAESGVVCKVALRMRLVMLTLCNLERQSSHWMEAEFVHKWLAVRCLQTCNVRHNP